MVKRIKSMMDGILGGVEETGISCQGVRGDPGFCTRFDIGDLRDCMLRILHDSAICLLLRLGQSAWKYL